MKKYYVNYYRNFANTYTLGYTDDAEIASKAIEQGWERITRKKAIELCIAERERSRYDNSFSGRASAYISPLVISKSWVNPDSTPTEVVEEKGFYNFEDHIFDTYFLG